LFYGQSCGEEAEEIYDKEIYTIPSDGILISQNKFKPGNIDYRYYYILKDGSKKFLPKINTTDTNKFGVLYLAAGNSEGVEKYTYEQFYISNTDSLKIFNAEYEKKFDSIKDKKLHDCIENE